MKKSVFALALAGAVIGTAALCVTGTVAACCIAAYEKIERARKKQDAAPACVCRSEACEKEKDEVQGAECVRTCYYLPSGGVYHWDKGCRRIAGREDVICATEQEANAAGKLRVCAFCAE